MAAYNHIYRKYIDKGNKSVTPERMRRGKFYMIMQYEYVDGTKGSYSIGDGPIIYTLFVSKAKDVVHAVKVSNVNPTLIKRFFGKMTVENVASLTSLPESPLMKKWWEYMKDIMVTNDDASPVSIPLKQVFFME